MANTPGQNKRSGGGGIVFSLLGMAITFLAGIYVGLHPNWIPVKGFYSYEISPPAMDSGHPVPRPVITLPEEHPKFAPATQPSTEAHSLPPSSQDAK